MRVLKTGTLDFPGVFACSRVLNFAIGAHEVFCLQSVSITVTAEVAGSSPVVPAIQTKELKLEWHP